MGAWKDADKSLSSSLAASMRGYKPGGASFSLEIKKLMSLGFSFEDSVRDLLKKTISELGESCSEEYFEYMVQQAIEDKEWLLR
ncbi:MAG: hypothetical protein K6A35_05635 [bacterium]|nr:hypothetical protein [bacterium]